MQNVCHVYECKILFQMSLTNSSSNNYTAAVPFLLRLLSLSNQILHIVAGEIVDLRKFSYFFNDNTLRCL